jgi:hypothetical protein
MTTTTMRELDRSAVLDAAVSSRRSADREEARLLAAAVHWVDLHPVTGEHPAAVFRASPRRGPLTRCDDDVPLAGEGTPGVATYAVEELAAALDLSYAAGLALVSEVAFVDRHLAVSGRHNRLPARGPVLHEARLQCDPDQALAVEQSALDHRGVWLDHRESTDDDADRPAGHARRPGPRRVGRRPCLDHRSSR